MDLQARGKVKIIRRHSVARPKSKIFVASLESAVNLHARRDFSTAVELTQPGQKPLYFFCRVVMNQTNSQKPATYLNSQSLR